MSISNAVLAGLMVGALVYGWLLPWLSNKLSEPKEMKANPRDYFVPGYIDADYRRICFEIQNCGGTE